MAFFCANSFALTLEFETVGNAHESLQHSLKFLLNPLRESVPNAIYNRKMNKETNYYHALSIFALDEWFTYFLMMLQYSISDNRFVETVGMTLPVTFDPSPMMAGFFMSM